MINPEQRKAYGRGYNAGRRGAWPEHKPPLPPNDLVAELMSAARDLRDAVDGMLATFEPDDELEGVLGPKVDAVDTAMRLIGKWMFGEEP